jgi:hypothetical protein
MRKTSIRCLLVCAVALSMAQALFASEVDPSPFLKQLPRVSYEPTLFITGTLPTTGDVQRWDLLLNDVIVFTSEVEKDSRLPVRLAVPLRSGNNVVSLVATYPPTSRSRITSRRWTTNVFRESDRRVERFALLLHGQSSSQNEVMLLDSLRVALENGGIATENILTPTTYSEFQQDLAAVRRKISPDDQVLAYYIGDSLVSGTGSESTLPVQRDNEHGGTPGVFVSDLLGELVSAGLPSAALVVDTSYSVPKTDPTTSARDLSLIAAVSGNTERMATTLLHSVSFKSDLQILIASPRVPGSAEPGDFTRQLLESLRITSFHGPACKALSDLVRDVENTASDKTPSPFQVLYVGGNASTRGVCVAEPPGQPRHLALNFTIGDSRVHPYKFAKISASIPNALESRWTETYLDGVLLKHRHIQDYGHLTETKSYEISDTLPLIPGRHLLEIRAGTASNVLATGSVQLPGPEQGIANFSSDSSLTAQLLDSTISLPGVTTEPAVPVEFVVQDDEEDGLRYNVRNNGVLMIAGMDPAAHKGHKLQVAKTIPLTLGVNNVVVEVRRGQSIRQDTVSIIRKPIARVTAVIVGTDTYRNLPNKTTAKSDAESVRSVLLNYTDASTGDINILTGSEATREAILAAIKGSPSAPTGVALDTSDETFFLFFSGDGATLTDATGAVTRCILPYDVDPTRLKETCIATDEIDQLLGSRKRSVVVFDTSYDGVAGVVRPPEDQGHPLSSRTYLDFLTPDLHWRLTSGVAQSDRMFLVASETNSPALEDTVAGDGLFTLAFAHAIQSQLSDQRRTTGSRLPELSLSDVYSLAKNETLALSDGQQTPVLKGGLSHPFTFYPVSESALKKQGRWAVDSAERAVQSLRLPNKAQLERAGVLFDKASALSPADHEAQLGIAAVAFYSDAIPTAQALADAAIQSLAAENATSSSALASWLLLRARIKMRLGDLKSAIEDAEQAKHFSSQSLRTTYLLAKLYAAHLQYQQSLALLNDLASRFGDSESEGLTDAEWADATVLAYIAFRRTNSNVQPTLALDEFATAQPSSVILLKTLLGYKLAKKVFAHTPSKEAPELELQETWSHAVAQYMLDPKKYEKALTSFSVRNALTDKKDPKSFDCMLHFYLGINALLSNDSTRARSELSLSVDTKQNQYSEYWEANSELQALQQH